MKQYFLFLLLSIFSLTVEAQKIYTKNGSISFFSKTSMENISASSNQALCVLDLSNGSLQFSILIKSFVFKKALMQEHFNENYMESNQFPKASYKGQVTDISNINFSKDGNYAVTTSGITQKINTPGTIIIKDGKVSANANFSVLLADYKIAIPKLVENNISKTIDIKITAALDQKM
jgi:hypothetical protein